VSEHRSKTPADEHERAVKGSGAHGDDDGSCSDQEEPGHGTA
jgi:hypothetical protein